MRQCVYCGVVCIDVDQVQYTSTYTGDKYAMLCDDCFDNLIDNG